MSDHIDTSFPIDDLPKECVHNPDNDLYSRYYDTNELCGCGSASWYDSIVETSCFGSKVKLTPTRIQRCVSCGEIRTCKLKKRYEKIVDMSTRLLDTLRKISDDDKQWFDIIGNIYRKLGNSLHGEKAFQDILTSMKKMKFKD